MREGRRERGNGNGKVEQFSAFYMAGAQNEGKGDAEGHSQMTSAKLSVF